MARKQYGFSPSDILMSVIGWIVMILLTVATDIIIFILHALFRILVWLTPRIGRLLYRMGKWMYVGLVWLAPRAGRWVNHGVRWVYGIGKKRYLEWQGRKESDPEVYKLPAPVVATPPESDNAQGC